MLGAAAVFVSDYSKVPVVRSRLRLGQAGGVRSSAPHNRREQNVISKRGAKTFGAKLQGFLFFATSYKVLEQIQEAHQLAMRVSSNESLTYGTGGTGGSADDTDASTVPGSNPGEGRGLSHVVLDFAAVVGVDGSAIAVFEKLRRWARREGTYWAFHQIPASLFAHTRLTLFFYNERGYPGALRLRSPRAGAGFGHNAFG